MKKAKEQKEKDKERAKLEKIAARGRAVALMADKRKTALEGRLRKRAQKAAEKSATSALLALVKWKHKGYRKVSKRAATVAGDITAGVINYVTDRAKPSVQN